MAVVVTCPHCGRTFKIKEKYAGKRGGCPHCKRSISVPAIGQEPQAPVKSPRRDPSPRSQPSAAPALRSDARRSSTFEFPCDQCGQLLRASLEHAGKPTRCGRCDANVTIPRSSHSPPRRQRSAPAQPPRDLPNPDLDLFSAAEFADDAPALAPLPKPAAKPAPHRHPVRRGSAAGDEKIWLVPSIAIVLVSFGLWSLVEGFNPAPIPILVSLMRGMSAGLNISSFCVCYKMFSAGKTGTAIVAALLYVPCGLISILITLSQGWTYADEWRIRRLMTVYTSSFIAVFILLGAILVAGGITTLQ